MAKLTVNDLIISDEARKWMNDKPSWPDKKNDERDKRLVKIQLYLLQPWQQARSIEVEIAWYVRLMNRLARSWKWFKQLFTRKEQAK